MTDDEVQTFEQLLGKKLSQQQEAVTKQISGLAKRVEDGFANTATIAHVDAIAKHLGDTMEKLHSVTTTLNGVVQTQREHSQSFDSIDRKLNAHLDRLDRHGTRIEVLEAKTSRLPAPPRRT